MKILRLCSSLSPSFGFFLSSAPLNSLNTGPLSDISLSSFPFETQKNPWICPRKSASIWEKADMPFSHTSIEGWRERERSCVMGPKRFPFLIAQDKEATQMVVWWNCGPQNMVLCHFQFVHKLPHIIFLSSFFLVPKVDSIEYTTWIWHHLILPFSMDKIMNLKVALE